MRLFIFFSFQLPPSHSQSPFEAGIHGKWASSGLGKWEKVVTATKETLFIVASNRNESQGPNWAQVMQFPPPSYRVCVCVTIGAIVNWRYALCHLIRLFHATYLCVFPLSGRVGVGVGGGRRGRGGSGDSSSERKNQSISDRNAIPSKETLNFSRSRAHTSDGVESTEY